MRVLLAHCDHRPFDVGRFDAAWRRAGGSSADLVPVTPTSADLAHDATGLLLAGGPDTEPWRYGSGPLQGATLRPDPARDALDLELLARAEDERWPVLAICYGLQILNVFHGGTLIQDLELADRPGHVVDEPKDFLAHSVALSDGGGRSLGGFPPTFAVNSRHHQGIDRIAEPLAAIASAPDGIVEAVEPRRADRFVLGVQWHPENIAAEPHIELFRRFRAACLVRCA